MPTETKKPKLTDKQQAVLSVLVEDDRLTVQEIADKLDISTQTVHAALAVLNALQIITREPRKARSIRVVEARA